MVKQSIMINKKMCCGTPEQAKYSSPPFRHFINVDLGLLKITDLNQGTEIALSRATSES